MSTTNRTEQMENTEELAKMLNERAIQNKERARILVMVADAFLNGLAAGAGATKLVDSRSA